MDLQRGLTVGRINVPVVDGDAQDVLVQVSDGELHGGVPLWVQCPGYHAGTVLLGAHAHFTVGIALPCRTQFVWLLTLIRLKSYRCAGEGRERARERGVLRANV